MKKALPLPGREQQVGAMVGFLQVNKPISGFGEARQSGSSSVTAEVALSSRWARTSVAVQPYMSIAKSVWGVTGLLIGEWDWD